MKKTMVLILMVMVMVMAVGCSVQPIGKGNPSGVGVIFDGEPLIFDSSVFFQGTVVGQILSREAVNGIARVSIALEGQRDDLIKNNLAAVVKNGRLHLNRFAGYGDPLPPGGYINGFVNTTSYRWFKLKHIINNINSSADRRTQRLLVQSGWGE
ncbi:hypothetical protein [Desulfosarcina sp.]|uniref:hypothetical protein n=1 Tax=Desulfosarcina sp. TaxID=2027861 RepID=UPI0035643C51